MTHYSHVMIAQPSTSAVRVFGKSMHTFSAGWVAAVGWLWIAQVQQHMLREGGPPPGYAIDTVVMGLIPAILIACAGMLINRWTGPAPDATMQRREWWHAFLWSLVPNLLLLTTVWIMIQEAR